MTMHEFFENFGIKINDSKIFSTALTHNSYANETKTKETYQRLEFLGDAVLQMYVSKFLYLNFTNAPEGKLTKTRSDIVRQETLSEIAKMIDLGKIIRLGQGEIKSKGYEKPSILSDVYEAVTAAIYLDQTEEVLISWIKSTIFKYIEKNDYKELNHDYKSELQEIIQAEIRSDLEYRVESQKHIEKDNKIEYTVSVNLDGKKYGIGTGFSKQEASQNAAKDCLNKLKKSAK
ncbi:ribonuclease III, dsRNA-specific ribonuclease [Mesoplasma florum L1]|uniref:Ribonuclease 3 n=2 Tax=Mesoplasma florum TaxID=2151 RepID=RNC_MESFL|nr:ribonuclease III [Mesoplasma florum]Q6F1N5.1 RecName: Full=Ribonuclease 3; AltName: Full=Ribonuclease III; Short=RNase III [Mesoplasma florum L1]AAT75588.1 ribonuclease III, dsRNA-specific ribonuclease [Mesoplasma florum L1]AGY41304.1 Ribonuclease III [Mesoplasma florum W37]ATI73186.1 ribonuclease 3 [Mesoplasma florum]ATI73873.1 ribonuclease 3 [Mesoplasma florum]AVN58839.1 ribonuclease 3 [Mesoplasma florum]